MGAFIPWLQEDERKLAVLFVTLVEGAYLSHRAIGAALGKSRNAIIGKIHRLKLSRDPLLSIMGVDHRVAPKPTQKETNVASIQLYGRNYRTKTVAGRPVRVEPVIGPSPHAVSIVEVKDKQCHFPMGTVGEEGFHLCGGDITVDHFGKDSPYCAFHHRLCYYPPKARDRPYVSGNKY